MSAGTITPYRSAQQAGHDGFPQLLRAEWIKFRSVRGWIIGMVVAGLLMLAVGLLGVQASIACTSGPHAPVKRVDEPDVVLRAVAADEVHLAR